MIDEIAQLVRQAETAANAGQWTAAEKLWSEIRRRDPRNPKAAFSLGVHAMQRRDFAVAILLIEEAQQASPGDPFILLTLSRAKREAGDEAGEGFAIEKALAIDPYYLPALLTKAQRLERIGNASAAAMFYRNCVKMAGPETSWPDLLRTQLARARDVAAKHSRDHHAQLNAALAPVLSALPRTQAERWREAASIAAGLTAPHRQHANQLYVPRLPAIPFYERSLFPWAEELEAKTDVIREELRAALASEQTDFQPYINLRPGQPVDQWRDLKPIHGNHQYRALWVEGSELTQNPFRLLHDQLAAERGEEYTRTHMGQHTLAVVGQTDIHGQPGFIILDGSYGARNSASAEEWLLGHGHTRR